MRLLDGLGRKRRLYEVVVGAGEARVVFRPQLGDDGERFPETLRALLGAVEGNAVGVMLELLPAGANAEVEPAAAHVIDGRRHLRQHRGIPVGVAGDEDAEPNPLRLRREGGKQRPRFEVGACLSPMPGMK